MASLALSNWRQRFDEQARQCPDRRVPDMPALRREAEAWERQRNAAVAKVDWQFTTADARVKSKKPYPTLQLQ